MRPATLAIVAKQTMEGEAFDRCLTNFLDGFYSNPSNDALADTPDSLAKRHGELGRVHDAYLAATAEELARSHALAVPGWVSDDNRKLRRPWFASSLAALRAVLLQESPAAFRSRNLFVSENALSRA